VAKAQGGVASSAPVFSSSGTGGAFLTLFNEKCFKNVQALIDCTNNEIKNEHLLEGVNLYIEMLKSQEAVIKTMESCKKPSDVQFMVQIAKDSKAKLVALGKPGRAVGTQLRCLEDSVNIFVWFMCSEKPDEFKETFGDFFGAVDFQGEKLTSDGNAENKKWFRAFRTVHQDFYEFIKSQHPKILRWTGSADDAVNVYKGFMG
jgi:hypothetical protein